MSRIVCNAVKMLEVNRKAVQKTSTGVKETVHGRGKIVQVKYVRDERLKGLMLVSKKG